MRKLSRQEDAFCHQYLLDHNAAAAARRAGYASSCANNAGYKLLCRRRVQDRLAELAADYAARVAVQVEDVLREWIAIGFFDIRRLYHPDGRLKAPQELDEVSAQVINAIEYDEIYEGSGQDRRCVGRTVRVKLADKHAALTNLARHFDMFERDNRRGLQDSLIGFLRELANRQDSIGPPAVRAALPAALE